VAVRRLCATEQRYRRGGEVEDRGATRRSREIETRDRAAVKRRGRGAAMRSGPTVRVGRWTHGGGLLCGWRTALWASWALGLATRLMACAVYV
jgi:hypothetical protein